jgi:(S)-mandelate dehydrogenase
VAPSPLEVLPAIRAAVGDDVELILDSGVRRGSDIVIARCLGARFSIFGRPTLFGAAAAGADGIDRVIRIVRSEVDMVLAQIGCPSFDGLHQGFLWSNAAAPAGAVPEVQHVEQPVAVA